MSTSANFAFAVAIALFNAEMLTNASFLAVKFAVAASTSSCVASALFATALAAVNTACKLDHDFLE